MKRSPKFMPAERNRESGLSMVEVIVAVVLIGMVATSAAAFFITGLATVSDLQRKQAAVSLANSAVERARAVAPGDVTGTGVSGLVKGRTQAAVTATWDAIATADPTDTADMNPAWDNSPSAASTDQWVPLTQTQRVNSQTYTITTLIGQCFRAKAATTSSANCVRTNPNPAGSSHIEMYRVRVVVSWSEGPGSELQTYRLATLIDPSIDAVWNTVLKPYAYDDEVSMNAGDGSQFFAVVANDQLDYNPDSAIGPIVDLTQPTPNYGSVAVGTGSQSNGVIFTPPDPSFSGTVTFTYKVRGTSGEVSNAATVTVHILPNPRFDEMIVAYGSRTILNDRLLANDYGTTPIESNREVAFALASNPTVDLFTDEAPPATVQARTSSAQELASKGISINAAGEVVYQAPSAGSGSDTVEFYYYLVDTARSGEGQKYPSALPAKVTITSGACVYVNDLEVDITADQRGEFVDLGINEANGNDADCLVDIVSVDYTPLDIRGQIRVGNNDYNATDNKRGSLISYRFQDDIPFQFRITYRMFSADGRSTTGETGVITVTVLPVAVDDTYTISPRDINGNNQRFKLANLGPKLRDNDAPNQGAQVDIELVSPLTCGRLTDGTQQRNGKTYLLNDSLEYQVPNNRSTCTFTYKLVGKNLPDVESETATVTIEVTN
ncbi:Ig-like domain-containing protein [Jonesia quinghaiensis]|uniref:Ig-like domain-containing protein n=1 Tax=Jonesia quinghaiensis TaxID=262806 RepID=UPI0012F80576|nr:prepilin-type N-terminal cleavage/methylation domain-containing protein [Jonesia quinghaiensis]